MILYELKHGIRERCIIDVNEIDSKHFDNLDMYLYQFPLQKKLVYAYLKYLQVELSISELHDMFKYTETLEYFTSERHQFLMSTDAIYNQVITKYVRNPWTWISSMLHIQPYLFDSKYLLIGRFQSIANKCYWTYMNCQSMHYSGIYNKVRTLEGLPVHNKWFVDRLSFEKQFFDEILKRTKFSKQLRVKTYHKFIEIFDDSSKLCMQYELTETDIVTRIIFPIGSKKRGRKQSTSLVMKLFSRYHELFTLYNHLLSKLPEITQYLFDLNEINVSHSDTYNRLHVSVMQVIQDHKLKETGTYNNSRYLDLYSVTNNSVERMVFGISKQYGRFRIYRRIKLLDDELNRYEEIHLSSYTMSSRSVEDCAHELLSMGFMTIGSHDKPYVTYDLELLATNKNTAFSLQFLKLPQIEATVLFDDYVECQEQLNAEVNYLLLENKDAKDSRKHAAHHKSKLSTWFEKRQLLDNPIKYELERDSRLAEKTKLINQFVKLNKKILT